MSIIILPPERNRYYIGSFFHRIENGITDRFLIDLIVMTLYHLQYGDFCIRTNLEEQHSRVRTMTIRIFIPDSRTFKNLAFY